MRLSQFQSPRLFTLAALATVITFGAGAASAAGSAHPAAAPAPAAKPAMTTPATPAKAPMAPKPTAEDLKLEKEVTMAFSKEAALAHVHATAKAGTVTLTGHVKTAQERQSAQSLAEKVTGVQKVVNNIEIKA